MNSGGCLRGQPRRRRMNSFLYSRPTLPIKMRRVLSLVAAAFEKASSRAAIRSRHTSTVCASLGRKHLYGPRSRSKTLLSCSIEAASGLDDSAQHDLNPLRQYGGRSKPITASDPCRRRTVCSFASGGFIRFGGELNAISLAGEEDVITPKRPSSRSTQHSILGRRISLSLERRFQATTTEAVDLDTFSRQKPVRYRALA